MKVGTQADAADSPSGVVATLVKLEIVPHATFPTASVTAGATKTLAV